MINAIKSSLANHNYLNVLKLSELLCDEYSYYYAGLAHFHLKSYRIAVSILGKQENHLPSIFLSAKCHFYLLEYAQSEHCCKQLLDAPDREDDGQVAQIWELLGKIQKRLNRNTEALHSFTNALELDPFLWTSFQELVHLGVEAEWPLQKDVKKTGHVAIIKRKQVRSLL